MILGTMSSECSIFIYEGFTKQVSVKEYLEIMTAGFKQHILEILKSYPPDLKSPDQRELMSTLATRWVFACAHRNFTAKVQNWNRDSPTTTYQYLFDFPMDFIGKTNNFQKKIHELFII
jgi:hypothetical protein